MAEYDSTFQTDANGTITLKHDCVFWLDMSVWESGQGFLGKVDFHSEDPDWKAGTCLPLFGTYGNLTIKIYEMPEEKLVFSRVERVLEYKEHNTFMTYDIKYIPNSEFEDKLTSGDKNGWTYLKFVVLCDNDIMLSDDGPIKTNNTRTWTDDETRLFQVS